MFRGIFSQIVMVALAIGIAFFYINPTFEEISKMQEETKLYQDEKQKVDRVNSQLDSLVRDLNSVSEPDQRKLLKYIPDEVDTIAVSRLLQIITDESGMLFEGVTYDKVDTQLISEAEDGGIENYPVPHLISVKAQGTYRQIKTMLRLMEQNEYPLEVHNLLITVVSEPLLNVDMQIVTYSHVEPPESEFSGL